MVSNGRQTGPADGRARSSANSCRSYLALSYLLSRPFRASPPIHGMGEWSGVMVGLKEGQQGDIFGERAGARQERHLDARHGDLRRIAFGRRIK